MGLNAVILVFWDTELLGLGGLQVEVLLPDVAVYKAISISGCTRV